MGLTWLQHVEERMIVVIAFACIKLGKAGVIPYKKIVPQERCYSLKLGSGVFCWSHLDMDA